MIPLPENLATLIRSDFAYFPFAGLGYYPVQSEEVYGRDYFEKYKRYAVTELSAKLTRFRLDLVQRFVGQEPVLDVGIGCGTFVESRNAQIHNTTGYDINPFAVEWLASRELYHNPYQTAVDHACFWDSLEHIGRPSLILKSVRAYAFVSIPIFRDLQHILCSKHFRKDEHFWYFTSWGLIRYMKDEGFDCVYRGTEECEFGREDIGTFVFKRLNPV
jgi:hypothetical protein